MSRRPRRDDDHHHRHHRHHQPSPPPAPCPPADLALDPGIEAKVRRTRGAAAGRGDASDRCPAPLSPFLSFLPFTSTAHRQRRPGPVRGGEGSCARVRAVGARGVVTPVDGRALPAPLSLTASRCALTQNPLPALPLSLSLSQASNASWPNAWSSAAGGTRSPPWPGTPWPAPTPAAAPTPPTRSPRTSARPRARPSRTASKLNSWPSCGRPSWRRRAAVAVAVAVAVAAEAAIVAVVNRHGRLRPRRPPSEARA